jgi:mannose-6-phosphate isomerase-like protein (cupin superfamily)
VVETAEGVLVADAQYLNEAAAVIRQIDGGGKLSTAADPVFTVVEAESAGPVNNRSYQIKHLQLAPETMLARHLPVFTAGHCVVIKGSGTIGLGHKTIAVAQGESFFIEAQTGYGIFNTGNELLELIEIHTSDNPEASGTIEKP